MCIFWILTPCQIYYLQIFFPFCWFCLFTLLTVSFGAQNFKIFMKFNLSIYPFICDFHVISKNSLKNQCHEAFVLWFFFFNFYYCRSYSLVLDPFYVNFCMVVGKGPISCFLHVVFQFSQHCWLKRLSFPQLNGLGAFVKNYVTIYRRLSILFH